MEGKATEVGEMVVVVVVFIMEAGKSAADLEDFSLSFLGYDIFLCFISPL